MAVKSYIDAIREAMDLALEKDKDVLIFVKMLVRTVVYSVQLMGYKQNMVKIGCSIHL